MHIRINASLDCSAYILCIYVALSVDVEGQTMLQGQEALTEVVTKELETDTTRKAGELKEDLHH